MRGMVRPSWDWMQPVSLRSAFRRQDGVVAEVFDHREFRKRSLSGKASPRASIEQDRLHQPREVGLSSERRW
jgi:hypothetical protein